MSNTKNANPALKRLAFSLGALYIACAHAKTYEVLGRDATPTDVAAHALANIPLVPAFDSRIHWSVRKECTRLMNQFNNSYEQASQVVPGYNADQLRKVCDGMKERSFWGRSARSFLQ